MKTNTLTPASTRSTIHIRDLMCGLHVRTYMEPRAVIGNTPGQCNQEESLLNVAEIRTDGGTQHRETDPSVIRQYAALMAAETRFPPLNVWFDGTYYWLTDGFHRLAAADKCGFRYVTAYIHNGSLEDAIWDSFCANSQHGLRRKRSDIVRLIERTLKHAKASSLSNVQIAKHLGIPEATVRRWRKRLSSSSDEDRFRQVNRRGTTYILHVPKQQPSTAATDCKWKSQQRVRAEIREILKLRPCPEIAQFLAAVSSWLAGGAITEFLATIESLSSEKRRPSAQRNGLSEG